jgi:hypothetical protein
MFRRIRREAALQVLRRDLLKVVLSYFGKAFADEVADTINTLDDLPRLERLFNATLLEGISADVFRMRLSAQESSN